MNYYLYNGHLYMCDELKHYGVPGMKWGHRKARPIVTSTGRRSSAVKEKYKNSAEHQAKVERRKKAAKVGLAVAGTALAAYGTYKVAKYAQNKRNAAAMAKAQSYIDKNFMRNYGVSKFKDGTELRYYQNAMGTQTTMKGTRSTVGKLIGQQNAKTVATGRQMYKDATNTKLDRGLAKVVNAGDRVGNSARKAASATSNAARKAASATSDAARKAASATSNAAKRAGTKATAPIRTRNEAIAAERGLKEANSLRKAAQSLGMQNVKVYDDNIINGRVNAARNDSLGNAIKNVYEYERNKRRR